MDEMMTEPVIYGYFITRLWQLSFDVIATLVFCQELSERGCPESEQDFQVGG